MTKTAKLRRHGIMIEYSRDYYCYTAIDLVLLLYSTYCISDSFTFADKFKTFNFPPSVFLCSYDICNLFTNVPLAETIEICADALYNGELTPPPFPHAVFLVGSCR